MKIGNKWEWIFQQFLDLTEFELVKYSDDYNATTDEYGHWGLIDLQGGNLGNIEGDRFETASQILDRMDMYIKDYLIDSIEEILADEFDVVVDYSDWSELLECAKKYLTYDYISGVDMLDMICNHFDEIDLEHCYYEEG